MAATTQLIRDTVSDYTLLCTYTGTASESATKKQDARDLKYRLFTVTFTTAPTTNLCIGEILTFDSAGTPAYAVVQDYTAGASTATCYLVTSGTDSTPIAASSGALPGTNKTVSGSISGSQPNTDASTAPAFNTPDFAVREIWWSTTNMVATVTFDGTTSQDIGYFTGGGKWDLRNSDMGSIPMTASGGTTLGDIKLAGTISGTNQAGYTVMVNISKTGGFNTPNYEKNGTLGYLSSRAGVGY